MRLFSARAAGSLRCTAAAAGRPLRPTARGALSPLLSPLAGRIALRPAVVAAATPPADRRRRQEPRLGAGGCWGALSPGLVVQGAGQRAQFSTGAAEGDGTGVQFNEGADATLAAGGGGDGVEAAVSVLPEIVADIAPQYPWYTAPVNGVQFMMETVHDVSGLPWWATVVVTTLSARVLILPIVVYTMKNGAKVRRPVPAQPLLADPLRRPPPLPPPLPSHARPPPTPPPPPLASPHRWLRRPDGRDEARDGCAERSLQSGAGPGPYGR